MTAIVRSGRPLAAARVLNVQKILRAIGEDRRPEGRLVGPSPEASFRAPVSPPVHPAQFENMPQAARPASRGARPLRRSGRRVPWPIPRQFPALALAGGLAIFGLGAAADLLYHGLPPASVEPLTPLLGGDGAGAHLTTFAGMLVILAAVVMKGLRRGS